MTSNFCNHTSSEGRTPSSPINSRRINDLNEIRDESDQEEEEQVGEEEVAEDEYEKILGGKDVEEDDDEGEDLFNDDMLDEYVQPFTHYATIPIDRYLYP